MPPDEKHIDQQFYLRLTQAHVATLVTAIAGAVYLIGVINCAIAFGKPISADMALVSAGSGYLCNLAQALFGGDSKIGEMLLIVSIIAGAGAGIALII